MENDPWLNKVLEQVTLEEGRAAVRLLAELDTEIKCIHLDMGGKHRYALGQGAHGIIKRMKNFLWEISRRMGKA